MCCESASEIQKSEHEMGGLHPEGLRGMRLNQHTFDIRVRGEFLMKLAEITHTKKILYQISHTTLNFCGSQLCRNYREELLWPCEIQILFRGVTQGVC